MGLPVEVNNLLLGGARAYTIGRSLRFRSSASAYLNRTPAAASNRKTWTWSAWVKRGTISANQVFFKVGNTAGSTDSDLLYCQFLTADTLRIGTGLRVVRVTNAVFRDPSAWYHIVILMDTTQATGANRTRIFINSTEQTYSTSSDIPQNTDTAVDNNVAHYIANYDGATQFFDGYLAEVNFIDGQALTPSSFGETDLNGIWQPKKYAGTYGTNGFYLPFSNTTSTTTLVQDSSGNGNNWTPNNISLTAGTTYDSMIDSPTVSVSSSNYAVLNPLYTAGGGTFSNGNLQVATGTSTAGRAIATMGVASGKWYWEITPTSIPANVVSIGIVPNPTTNDSGTVGNNASEYAYLSDGQKFSGGSAGAYGASYVANDVIGVALDLDAGTLVFYKNGTSQGTAYSSVSLTNTYIPAVSDSSSSNSGTFVANFGQRPFSYTPPTGFNALNTYNLPAASITNGAQYNATSLYTGNGGTAQTITNTVNNTSFQPDFVWIKSRNSASFSHRLYDSIRGVGKELYSNATNAESTVAQSLTAFATNGFTLGTDTNNNASGTTYVGWQWKGGGTAVTNNSGTISSQVSANASAGFSIVTYTGTGANATVGHGLGVAPSFIIAKARNSAQRWTVYTGALGNGYYGYLNETFAFDTANASLRWNTAPTSSVFGVGTSVDVNSNTTTYVAYCFAAVRGYSAFGSYVGTGNSDGPFIFTNFRPRFVMVKSISGGVGDWEIRDSSRDIANVSYSSRLFGNSSAAEDTSGFAIDLLSNGFKCRGTGTNSNGSGYSYIYMAFAEHPFNISRGR